MVALLSASACLKVGVAGTSAQRSPSARAANNKSVGINPSGPTEWFTDFKVSWSASYFPISMNSFVIILKARQLKHDGVSTIFMLLAHSTVTDVRWIREISVFSWNAAPIKCFPVS